MSPTGEPRITPWMSPYEWLDVCKKLSSNTELDHICKIMAVWKARAHFRLPISVECTMGLISAKVNDDRSDKSCELVTRLTYALAVIRFVNLITERSQRNEYAIPIHELARELKLPEWVVELRHEATHSSVFSSLIQLRSAYTVCLKWLLNEYWNIQAAVYSDAIEKFNQKNISPSLQPNQNDSVFFDYTYFVINLQSLFIKYQEIQFQRCKNSLLTKENYDLLSKELECTMEKILKCFETDHKQAIWLFVSDHFFLMTKNQLQCLSSKLIDYLEKVQHRISEFTLSSATSNDCNFFAAPKHLYKFWYPLIYKLCESPKYIAELFRMLNSRLHSDDNQISSTKLWVEKVQITMWIAILCNSVSSFKGSRLSIMRTSNSISNFNIIPLEKHISTLCYSAIPKRDTFKSLIRMPSIYTRPLICLFYNNLLSAKERQSLLLESKKVKLWNLIDLMISASDIGSCNKTLCDMMLKDSEKTELNKNIYTVNDLKRLTDCSIASPSVNLFSCEEEANFSEGSIKTDKNSLTENHDVDIEQPGNALRWSEIPLGLFPVGETQKLNNHLIFDEMTINAGTNNTPQVCRESGKITVSNETGHQFDVEHYYREIIDEVVNLRGTK